MTEIFITWVDEKVTERSNTRLCLGLNTDFNEEKYGGWGRIKTCDLRVINLVVQSLFPITKDTVFT